MPNEQTEDILHNCIISFSNYLRQTIMYSSSVFTQCLEQWKLDLSGLLSKNNNEYIQKQELFLKNLLKLKLYSFLQ